MVASVSGKSGCIF